MLVWADVCSKDDGSSLTNLCFVSVASNNVLKQVYLHCYCSKPKMTIALLCQSIYDKTVGNTDKLADYGIMEQHLSKLKGTINLTQAAKRHDATEQRNINGYDFGIADG